MDEATENRVVQFAIDYPAYGQLRVSNDLRKEGVFVSPSGVRSIWLRHGLESMKLRLAALEKRSADEGLVLTEAQVQALKRRNRMMKLAVKLKPLIRVILAARILFMWGQSRGVGRIYQQTFVDTYSKVAFAKLYKTKTPITAADLLNDKGTTIFMEHEMGIIRMLYRQGTEYCGKVENS